MHNCTRPILSETHRQRESLGGAWVGSAHNLWAWSFTNNCFNIWNAIKAYKNEFAPICLLLSGNTPSWQNQIFWCCYSSQTATNNTRTASSVLKSRKLSRQSHFNKELFTCHTFSLHSPCSAIESHMNCTLEFNNVCLEPISRSLLTISSQQHLARVYRQRILIQSY